MASWFSLVLGVLIAIAHVHGKPSTEDFISIDCGALENYTDSRTKIPYTTDDDYIQTGENGHVLPSYLDLTDPPQYLTVRSFPDGVRNCYTLKPVIKYQKYLIRASFMYGSYNGTNSIFFEGDKILFDLHIGVNFWKTVNITDVADFYVYEAITVALDDYISVCLIKTGNWTPFISALELRPLKTKLYPLANASQALVLVTRMDMGNYYVVSTPHGIRYPDDPYDRRWMRTVGFSPSISTNSTITVGLRDPFEVPSVVLETASVAWKVADPIEFSWNAEDADVDYYAVLHFCEVENLSADNVREFSIFLNQKLWFNQYRPPYLVADAIYSTSPLAPAATYDFSINATRNATVPPIINAFEVFYLIPMEEVSTETGNVDAMLAIKAQYQVKKNWMGDPCSPKDYAWDGLHCNYDVHPLRIVALNLSSNGLLGTISTSFSMLTAVKSLDLSYNNLTGPIPNFLSNMESLRVLNLTGNHFTGAIPDALLQKSLSGSLVLRY